jgi:hypothetical protein
MTFLEAAIEILRNADEPMHFSEVARRAVEGNLLSHVGRDPEAAMRSCLNSAVRMGRGGEDPIIMRDKPGYYGIRPGAQLPDPPPRPAAPGKPRNSEGEDLEVKASSRTRTSSRKSGRKAASSDGASASRGGRRSARGRRSRAPVEAEEPVEVEPEEAASEEEIGPDAETISASGDLSVEFEAPMGSGLDGVTDVELVMANAVSRLVEERPELRDELDAMQQAAAERETTVTRPFRGEGGSAISRRAEDPGMGPRGAHRVRDMAEERSSRRRRRRRRRGKRVDWTGPADTPNASTAREKLLDQVAKVLEDSGPRSLHVRQVAETLAGQGVLGGEISEIERAVTSAVLLDINMRGRASRFVARGDARYQLQGTRLPERAAAAEQALREAARALEEETRGQLIQWLHSLGARALESLVRMYLAREGYQLVSAMPPARGVGKLVLDDVEDDGRVLAIVVPRRTGVDPKLWEGEPERNGCSSVLLFTMADPPDDWTDIASRCIVAGELAHWLQQNRIGVQQLKLDVAVLDATVIESIAGLDT